MNIQFKSYSYLNKPYRTRPLIVGRERNIYQYKFKIRPEIILNFSHLVDQRLFFLGDFVLLNEIFLLN